MYIYIYFFLIKACSLFFLMQCYCTLNRLQYSVNIAFTCTGKPKDSYESLYCDICFIVVVWAAVHGVAKSQTRRSDFTFTFSLSYIGEGNGNPLQCSCLEIPRGRRAWWAAVYRVTQSRTLAAAAVVWNQTYNISKVCQYSIHEKLDAMTYF